MRALFILALGSVLVTGALLVQAAGSVDGISRRYEEAQLRNGLRARIAELQAAVVPQADWDDAVANLGNRYDAAWAQANVGAYFSQNSGFERAYVVGADDAPLFAMVGGETVAAARFTEVRAAAAPLIARVRAAEARRGPFAPRRSPSAQMISQPIQASTAAMVAGSPHILTATLVQPDFGAALPEGPRAPVVITAEAVDGAFRDKLAERYELASAQLHRAGAAAAPDLARLEIRDDAQRTLAVLTWRARTPGADLMRQAALPAAAILSVLLVGLFLVHRAAQDANARLLAADAELRAALAAADSANQAKSEFLAMISHEIRTPLNAVIGALHLLQAERLTDDGRRLAVSAVSSGQVVNALVNDVLDYSKLVNGQVEIVVQPTDLTGLAGSAAGLFRAQCEQKGLSLETDIDPAIGWGATDPLRLNQCLFNLLGNAVKFTEAGFVRLSAVRLSETRVRFSVADSGIGIAPEALEAIFERFTQADADTARRYGGSGLGLSITRSLARLLGGDVIADSAQGHGSTFTVEIDAPVCAPAGLPRVETEATNDLLAGLTILVVDDNAANRMIASKLLERLGAVVITADDGAAGVQTALDQAPDLVLMDIRMPGMDGVEATRRLRALPATAQLPVIALTANVLDHQRDAYKAAGMQDVVGKPVAPDELLTAIVRVFTANDEQPREATG
jgi:signal transduction histidine kinase/ActR/RegA family two-component response regulator